jgi:hypothetical protein
MASRGCCCSAPKIAVLPIDSFGKLSLDSVCQTAALRRKMPLPIHQGSPTAAL